ncbi:hypothetical protein D9M71_734610 [compost metagenome]
MAMLSDCTRGGICSSWWPWRLLSGNRATKADSSDGLPVRSRNSAGVPVARTLPSSIATSQSKRSASSM